MANAERLPGWSQAYILMVVAAGGALLALTPMDRLGSVDIPYLVVLGTACGLAAIAQVVRVEGTTSKTSYNLGLLVYGFTLLLLGPGAATLVVIFASLVDWTRNRHPWLPQAFNTFSLVVNVHVAGLVYHAVMGADNVLSWRGALALTAAAACFVISNHAMVGLAAVLARGESFAQSGAFGKTSLLMDVTLFASGSTAGLLWLVSPFLVPLLIVPLYMLSVTLKVPSLERQMTLDAKTGLHNARYFHEFLDRELARANRHDSPLSVIVADLDLLRDINNTYGHLAGDTVLTGVAKILKDDVRESDVVARFGGEEFSIVMPNTALADAVSLGERLRSTIESTQFWSAATREPVRATMSFGVAQRTVEQNAQEILHRADLALYQAKAEGRNRVRAALDQGSVDWMEGGKFFCRPEAVEAGPAFPQNPVPEKDLRADAEPTAAGNPTAAIDTATAFPQTATPDPHPDRKDAGSNAIRGFVAGWRSPVFMVALVLVAVGALWISLAGVGPVEVNWYMLGILAAIAALTEFLSVDIHVRETPVSTSAAPFVAAAVLFGPLGVVVLSLAAAGPALFKHRNSPTRLTFNISSHVLAGLTTVWVVQAVANSAAGRSHWLLFALNIVGVGLLFGITTALASMMLAINGNDPFRTVWKEKFSWLALYYLGLGILAGVIVLGYQHFAYLGVVAALTPLFVLRWGQKEYVKRTRVVLAALRKSNESLKARAAEISDLNEGLLGALAKAVELRDPFVLGHSHNVARNAVMLGRELGLPEERLELIRKAALLHDIGKLGIGDDILFKPGGLTPDEYDAVKAHPGMATEVLGACRCLDAVAKIVLYHHERYDGRGYPDGLAGTVIPLESRILAVADALEAMTSERPHHPVLAADVAMKEIRANAGGQFDPQVVAALLSMLSREADPAIVDSATMTEPRVGTEQGSQAGTVAKTLEPASGPEDDRAGARRDTIPAAGAT